MIFERATAADEAFAGLQETAHAPAL